MRAANRTKFNVTLATLIVALATLQVAVSATTNTNGQPASTGTEDLKAQVSKDASQATNLRGPTERTNANSNETATHGRSMEPTQPARQSTRGGRMLDLDHLAGDIGKDEKMSKERSLSGERQSRILNEDIALEGKEAAKIAGRSKKSKGKKKMAISGFIPIMSLEGAKDGKHFDALESAHGDDDEQEEEPEQQQNGDHQVQQSYSFQPDAASSTKNQLISSFGGQTSIGHASFGVQPTPSEQQQQSQQQWQQLVGPTSQYAEPQQDARANRKLLGSGGILGSLGSSKRFVSSLVQPPHLALQSLQSQNHNQFQGPMNMPQCINGYLSESQLSKSQLQQFVGFSPNPPFGGTQHQIPRSLNLNSGSQSSDLYYASQPQQLSSLMAKQVSAQAGQSSDQQQLVNDIYDQLRKRIESENLEQQLQAQYGHSTGLDERSKAALQQLGSQNRTDGADTLERSLVNPLGRRSSSQQKCGIMRTCCKIPQTLAAQNLPSQQQMLGLNRGQHSSRLGTLYQGAQSLRPQQAAISQPQYQMLQANVQPPQLIGNHQPGHQPGHHHHQHQHLQLQQPQQLYQQVQTHQQQPHHQHQQQLDYQPATSSLVPSVQSQLAMASQQRPAGSFMAGRCGTKQTIGISGRVQNNQPAPGSETNAEFGEFPSHVAILKRLSPGDSLFVCSAVLVSNQWVATAAHCVRKHRPEDLKLRLGEWDVNRDDEFYPFVESNVREIVIHPDFQSSSLINDIALLRLDSSIDPQQMPHITPACLATPDELFGQQRCWVTGWGKDAFGQGGAFQSVLKKVDLPVVGRQECEMALRYQTKLGKFFRLHQSAMCAGGERGKDACEGDGGAGLYCTDADSGLTKVAGLVSWGVGCGQKGVPGVYTNLAAFYNWIETVISASGEESLYLDRNGVPDNTFKNLISERSNAAINGTIGDVSQKQSNNSTSPPEPLQPTTLKPIETETAESGEIDKELESRSG